MNYLVDTDWIIDYLTGQPEAGELFAKLAPGRAAISIISFSEIYEGIYGSRNPALGETAFRAFLRQITVLGISQAVAKRNGQIRRQLRSQRRQITHRAFDLLIAATAVEHNLILVTRNMVDYQDVPGVILYQLSGETT